MLTSLNDFLCEMKDCYDVSTPSYPNQWVRSRNHKIDQPASCGMILNFQYVAYSFLVYDCRIQLKTSLLILLKPLVNNRMVLKIIIWDVEHGTAISVRLPNGKVLMLDCATNDYTGFSPIQVTKDKWKRLDLLIMSHPHLDHISDIHNIDRHNPPLFLAPYVDPKQLLEGKNDEIKDIFDKYMDLLNDVQYDINVNYKFSKLSRDVSTLLIRREKWGGVDITWFGLNGYQENINDYSLVTFLTYGSFTFAYAGDLSSNGWESLIRQEGAKFTRMLKKTNFFVVAHHGRKEGYNPLIFDSMQDLKMAFISDKNLQRTSVTDRYSKHCKGWKVINENSNYKEYRYVLTTRKDGRIIITATQDYRTTEVRHWI